MYNIIYPNQGTLTRMHENEIKWNGQSWQHNNTQRKEKNINKISFEYRRETLNWTQKKTTWTQKRETLAKEKHGFVVLKYETDSIAFFSFLNSVKKATRKMKDTKKWKWENQMKIKWNEKKR